ncbi:MAG: hypothetical protein JSS49_02905 [Planctomycetes bacterium]|nr:hypothetical protein [Planctomycetota bacterium]
MTRFDLKWLVFGLLASTCIAQEQVLSVQPGQEFPLSTDQGYVQPTIQGQTLIIPGSTPAVLSTEGSIPVPGLVPEVPGVAPGTVPVPVVPVIPGQVPGRRGNRARVVPTLPVEFEAKDKNRDGQIGMYEWERSKYAEFIKLDKNGDGFLTPAELLGKRATVIGLKTQEPLPNPGNLVAYGLKIGESFSFNVTGQTTGSVYGTGTYTTDSSLAAVAVHAGVLKEGQTGVVQVTIVAPPAEFTASSANGVTSSAWGQYPAAYTVR